VGPRPVVAIVAAAALFGGACDRTAAVGDLDVAVAVGQARHLEGSNRIQVSFTFAATEPVAITALAVRSGWFEPLPPERRTSILHPGRTVDVQVDLGTPVCDRESDAPPAVELELQIGETPRRRARLPLPSEFLADFRDRACRLERLGQAVEVGFGPPGPAEGTRVASELVLRRRAGDAPIRVDQIRGSVVFQLLLPEGASTAVAALGKDEQLTRIPVAFVASRCDPHGASQSQKTFRFPAWVAVGDDPPVYVELEPDDGLRAALQSAIQICLDADGSEQRDR
jgi:hypothetical protein